MQAPNQAIFEAKQPFRWLAFEQEELDTLLTYWLNNFVDAMELLSFVKGFDPIKQFEMLKEITQPGLLNGETEEEECARQTAPQHQILFKMDSTYQAVRHNSNLTVYLSE
jgi:hypothetical protein